MGKFFKSAITSAAVSWGWRNRAKLINAFKGRPGRKDHSHDPAGSDAPMKTASAYA